MRIEYNRISYSLFVPSLQMWPFFVDLTIARWRFNTWNSSSSKIRGLECLTQRRQARSKVEVFPSSAKSGERCLVAYDILWQNQFWSCHPHILYYIYHIYIYMYYIYIYISYIYIYDIYIYISHTHTHTYIYIYIIHIYI